MSDLIRRSEEYRRQKRLGEMRGGSGAPSLKFWFLVALSGSGILFGIAMSIK